MSDPANRWSVSSLRSKIMDGDRPFHTFIDTDTMTVELYEVPAGAVDMQTPHDLDELYYLTAGRSKFKSGDDVFDVKSGDTIFVKAHEPHRFFDISEDIVAIVFFSKKEPSK